MSIGIHCHTMWEDHDVPHLCGRDADHASWHLCVCGAILHTGRSSLTEEQTALRKNDCPVCLARTGRPCHTRKNIVMSGVHRERRDAPERRRAG